MKLAISQQLLDFLELLKELEVTPERLGEVRRTGILRDIFDNQATLPPRNELRKLMGLYPLEWAGLIDCNHTETPMTALRIHKQSAEGHLKFDATSFELYLSAKQIAGETVTGIELLEEMKSRISPNYNLLRHISGLAYNSINRDYPKLGIPDSWKSGPEGRKLKIHFFGTVFENDVDHQDLCVAFMQWAPYDTLKRDSWVDGVTHLDECVFDASCPALVLKDPALLLK